MTNKIILFSENPYLFRKWQEEIVVVDRWNAEPTLSATPSDVGACVCKILVKISKECCNTSILTPSNNSFQLYSTVLYNSNHRENFCFCKKKCTNKSRIFSRHVTSIFVHTQQSTVCSSLSLSEFDQSWILKVFREDQAHKFVWRSDTKRSIY